MDDLKQILQNNGFKEHEAKVYLASLKLGLSPVSEIARQASLNRVTTYEILKRLHHKGFVSVTQKKSGTNYFSVLNPDRLFQRLKNNLDEFQGNLKKFLSIKNQVSKKPKVLFFEGQDGLREVYKDFMSYENNEVLSITNAGALWDAIDRQYIKKTFKKRKQLNIKVKSLAPDTPEGISALTEGKIASRDLKLFPHKQFNIPNEIVIYADKVALMSFTDKIAVIIENKEIAESMRNIWQMAWGRFK